MTFVIDPSEKREFDWVMKKIILLPLALCCVLISGCTTSSGVVAVGPDTYMISRTQWGFRGPGLVKAAAIKEADAYCKKHGKEILVIKTVESGVKFGSEPAAQVYFKALDLNDPELKQPPPIQEIVR
jgi:predicted small secreted protein